LSFLPKIRGIKAVVHVHALDWKREKWGLLARRFLMASEGASVRFPDATVAVSKELRHYLENKYGHRVDFVPQGVDHPDPQEPDEILRLGLMPSNYVLFMARLVPEKGLHHVLDAYAAIQGSGVGSSLPPLVVAGSGAHSSQYVEHVRGVAPAGTRFRGHVDGRLKAELLSHATLFVQPSDVEGLSIGLLEAMAYSNTVLASDIPENVEAGGESVAYFRSGDPKSLRLELEKLFEDPVRRERLAAAAKQHVKQGHDWDSIAQLLEQVYTRVLDSSEPLSELPEADLK
jgi:glycosyltransferase involved in cell wall biosynthesis